MIGKTLPEDTLLAFFHKNNVKKPVIKLRPRHKIEIGANETSIQHFEQDVMAGYISTIQPNRQFLCRIFL